MCAEILQYETLPAETYLKYETVIGLEVHAELATVSKIYCGCSTAFKGEVNTHTCPICSGMPGVLPVLNKKAVDYAIKAGLAANCSITPLGKQDRKNYFYPDLPKAYQTSQYDLPICVGGYLDISCGEAVKRVGITRIHIEEDAGKLLHEAEGLSLVDLNRCGVPLIEIVTEPDLRGAEEARVFLETLKSILEYTEVSDCKMQEGSLRCDVNVSVRLWGAPHFGTRTELKNLNSFRAAVRAIEYEARRQIEVLEADGAVVQETRRWDDETGETCAMRGKEEAHDYRYFPEPDLTPIVISEEWIAAIRATIPELPQAKTARYMKDFGLSEYDARHIAASKAAARFLEETIAQGAPPKAAANWLLGDIAKILNEQGGAAEDIPFAPEHLARLIALIENGVLSSTAAKKVAEELFASPRDPEIIAKEKGLVQISDDGVLARIAADIIAQNPQSVHDYKAGKEKALGFLMGQAMRASRGQGNPQIFNRLIKEQLDEI